jgi:hypothetical protein
MMSANNRDVKKPDELLRSSELASKLAKYGGSGGLITLQGYIGTAESQDAVLLYLDEDFTQSAQFNKSDVVHAQKMPETDSGLQPVKVWIPKSKEITYTRTESIREKASFLEGEIAQAQVRPAEMIQRAGGIDLVPHTFRFICGSLNPRLCGPIITFKQRSCLILCDPITYPRRSCLIRCGPISDLVWCDPITAPVRCEIITANKSCNAICTNIAEICVGVSGGGWQCPVDVESLACKDPVVTDPVLDLTTQIKELVEQVKLQNAQLRKLAERGTG